MLLFIHITKTAGGSIKRVFREGDVDCQFHYPGESGFSRDFHYSPEREVVYGHYKFGAHDKIGVEPNYACFVRDPVSRTLSHFNHLKNVARVPVGDRAREAGDIKTFISKYSPLDLDNHQTRLLSGVGRNTGYGGLRGRALNLAVSNLKRYFSFIGVFEKLDESLNRLSAAFPGLNIEHVPHVNRGRYENEVDDEALELIRSRNELDFQVYEKAIRLFEAS